jgi:hypothetical protein
MSGLLHVALGVLAWLVVSPSEKKDAELVDIEVAPPPPKAEALPPEVAKPPEEDLAANTDEAAATATPPPPEPGIVDAGVDAPIDAAVPPDAPPDAAPDAAIDAAPDAAEALIADQGDAGADATPVASADDAGAGDATIAAIDPGAGSAAAGSGSGAGADSTVAGRGSQAGSGSGLPGATDEPAVDGAPTTAGTAANLLSYFPDGHTVTAMIRFDRLRNTEWLAQTERLLRPMPDYRILFGPRDAKVGDKLDTLVISTPRPKDATATTLVAHTKLSRADLRGFLGATTAVDWSAARGGLLGRRTGKLFPGDKRVFLSPFKGWFLLAQPGDLGALTAAAPGTPDLDAAEARGKLPPWLAGIRTIEAESGDPRGPALVVTLGLGGKRVVLGDDDFGLGIESFPTPDRVSLAMELVKQGWLVRGNMRFANEADAAEFVTAAETAQQRITNSRALQLAVGKPAARVVANLSFARTGPRVSYATSISIADARAILTAAAQQLDGYFGPRP